MSAQEELLSATILYTSLRIKGNTTVRGFSRFYKLR